MPVKVIIDASPLYPCEQHEGRGGNELVNRSLNQVLLPESVSGCGEIV